MLGVSEKERLDSMVHDVIISSMEQPEIRMSAEVGQAMADLRKFMFQHVYLNPKAKGEEKKAVHLVKQLFEYYAERPDEMPQKYRDAIESGKCEKEQSVCDFIAGMTDHYAVMKYEEIFVPKAWKN